MALPAALVRVLLRNLPFAACLSANSTFPLRSLHSYRADSFRVVRSTAKWPFMIIAWSLWRGLNLNRMFVAVLLSVGRLIRHREALGDRVPTPDSCPDGSMSRHSSTYVSKLQGRLSANTLRTRQPSITSPRSADKVNQYSVGCTQYAKTSTVQQRAKSDVESRCG